MVVSVLAALSLDGGAVEDKKTVTGRMSPAEARVSRSAVYESEQQCRAAGAPMFTGEEERGRVQYRVKEVS